MIRIRVSSTRKAPTWTHVPRQKLSVGSSTVRGYPRASFIARAEFTAICCWPNRTARFEHSQWVGQSGLLEP